ncbi:MAG: WD40 repeat domain-containing protein [Candidatus Babeliaceae bacterium]
MKQKLIAWTSDEKKIELPVYAGKFSTIENMIEDISQSEGDQEIPLPVIHSSDLQNIFACLHEDGTVNEDHCEQLAGSQWAAMSHAIEYLGYEALRQTEVKALKLLYGSKEYATYFIEDILKQNKHSSIEEIPLPAQQEIIQRMVHEMVTNYEFKRNLVGHKNIVNVLLATDKNLFSGSYDKTIKRWNIETGKEIQTFTGHRDMVRALVVKGNKLVSGAYDKTIKIWDIETGKEIRTLTGHINRVMALALKGNKLFSSSFDGTIKIWDIETGEEIQTLIADCDDEFCGLAIKGNKLYSISRDNTIKVWNIETKEMQQLTGHDYSVCALALEGNKFYSGSSDKTIKIWDASTDTTMQTLAGHGDTVKILVVQDNKIYSGSDDGSIKIWDASTGQQLKTLTVFEGFGEIRALAASDDKLFFCNSNNHFITVWWLAIPEDFKKESKKLSYRQAAILSYIKFHENEPLSEEARAVYETINPEIKKYFK